jgi:hypothetical protein
MKKKFYSLIVFWVAMLFAGAFSDLHAQGWTWGRGGDVSFMDAWLVATDPSGNVFGGGWTEAIGTGAATVDFGSGVTYAGGSSGIQSVWVKYNNSGTALWAGGISTGNNYMYGMTADGAGNLIVFGEFSGASITIGSFTLSNPSRGSQYYLAKIDPSGTVLWAVNDGGIISSYSSVLGALVLGMGGVTTDVAGNIYISLQHSIKLVYTLGARH